ncbi:MAG TPA: hypothetical protein GX509_02240 [Firmicutes bacterium]|nr:hypothetical protein [Bacillota bacterium]
MNSRSTQVGFSQRVRLEWLEQVVGLILAGNDRPAIFAAFQDLLRDKVSVGGSAERGNREKIISIIMKTWFNPPRELDSLRGRGLELVRRLPRTQQIVVHWGMVMAVYPFWAAVAGIVGRLLKLQGSAATIHIQRRVQERYGERETVARAARRVVRSYLDWGVLKKTGAKGIYDQGLSVVIDDPELAAWLIEAFLHIRDNRTATLKEILDSPSLFPFRFQLASLERTLTTSPRLEVLHLGLDEDVVTLQ